MAWVGAEDPKGSFQPKPSCESESPSSDWEQLTSMENSVKALSGRAGAFGGGSPLAEGL